MVQGTFGEGAMGVGTKQSGYTERETLFIENCTTLGGIPVLVFLV